MEHEWVDPILGERCAVKASGDSWPRLGFVEIQPQGSDRLFLAMEIMHLAQKERAANEAIRNDVAALLRAAGLPDHARDASPHQVIQQELLPEVQRLVARERVLAERVTQLEVEVLKQAERRA